MSDRETDFRALEADLSRRFRVVNTPVDVADSSLNILHPANAEDLISEADFERDERLPYWAELWPSSLVLAKHLAGLNGAGRELLELGCGSGLVSTCAARAGFRVVASDYYEDAVRFARLNAWRNAAVLAGGMTLDWRHLPRDLKRFDTVIASDVLYELPYGRLVASVIGRALAPKGVAIVADPGRVGRDAFLEALDEFDLHLVGRAELPYRAGKVTQTITLFELQRPGDLR